MTHGELLELIDTHMRSGNMTLGQIYLCNALMTVVELHKPCEPVSDDNFVTCETCNYEYFREYPYPCETIQVIEEQLK